MHYSRRKFISFLGKASVGATIIPPFLMSCGNTVSPSSELSKASHEYLKRLKKIVLTGIHPSDKDDLLLASGLDYHIIARWGDKISDKDYFGFNNDFTCFIPLNKENPNDGLLWVNHEYASPLFVSGFNFYDHKEPLKHRTLSQVDKEMYNVGGSIIRIKEENGRWSVVKNDPHNRRITGQTPINFNWDHPIKGQSLAMGTNSNCSGGITPWNTFLSCEENYDNQFGETVYDENNKPKRVESWLGWEKFYEYPPEHYGWVVEIDPKSGAAQKHIALGRFSHECCTLYELEDKRIVAYSGDDKEDEHVYKFISSKPHSLKEGTLYVADTIKGNWGRFPVT